MHTAAWLPYLQLFANSDIGNMTKREDQCPPKDYMEAVWGSCPPVQCERDRTFDFRTFCCTKVAGSWPGALQCTWKPGWPSIRHVQALLLQLLLVKRVIHVDLHAQ